MLAIEAGSIGGASKAVAAGITYASRCSALYCQFDFSSRPRSTNRISPPRVSNTVIDV